MTRSRLALLLLLLPLTLPAWAQCPDGVCRPRPQAPAGRTVADCTVMVTFRNARGAGLGSATCIRAEPAEGRALYLTAAHLFEGGVTQVTARFPDGRSLPGELLALGGADTDLAAFTTAAPAEGLPTAGVAAAAPAAGARLWKVGYPLGRGPDTREGTAGGSHGGFAWARLYVNQGDSGGGVFTADGKLVGVVSGYSTQDRMQMTMASHPEVKRFLDQTCWPRFREQCRPRDQPQSARPAPPPPPSDAPLPAAPPPPAARAEPGPRGEPGPPGPPGPPGRDADLATIKALQAKVDALEAKLNGLSGSIRVRVEPVPKKER